MLLRVRRLIFEMLERRSMLAADAETLDGYDAVGTVKSDVGEAVGGEPEAAVFACQVEERIEPEIAGCWLTLPESWCLVPPTGGGCPELPEAEFVEPVVESAELEPSDDAVADDAAAEPAADQFEVNVISEEAARESVDEAVGDAVYVSFVGAVYGSVVGAVDGAVDEA
ncbi:MAG: hypothetical protein ACKOTB_02280, partial [Planctomycetia bacterium]